MASLSHVTLIASLSRVMNKQSFQRQMKDHEENKTGMRLSNMSTCAVCERMCVFRYTRVCTHAQAEAPFHSDPGRSLKGWLWRWDLNDMKEPDRQNTRTVHSPAWRHSKNKGPEARTDVGSVRRRASGPGMQRTEETAGGSEREG